MNRKRLLDKISTQELLDNLNMLSVNQMNAQIKITEVWKSQKLPNYPLKTEKVCHDNDTCKTRAVSNGDLKEFGKSELLQSTFLSDASKSWNKCPNDIILCETLSKAKKAIRIFVKTLPV